VMQPTRPISSFRLRNDELSRVIDLLVVEEPLEIRVNGRRFTTTMRTPMGQDEDEILARGLLLTEGVICDNDDIERITFDPRCRDLSSDLINILNVTLHEEPQTPAHLWERALISNSSCGLCGKASIEALRQQVPSLPSHPPVASDVLLSLSAKLREQQTLFRDTGGLHAAAIFSSTGGLLSVAEDIGRHNATDRAIGRGLQEGWLPWSQSDAAILLVSGRASFELAQKALMARLPMLCAVSAASSLAVELASAHHLTLVAFLRERGFSVYAGEERIRD
jgi:FdhD protein